MGEVRKEWLAPLPEYLAIRYKRFDPVKPFAQVLCKRFGPVEPFAQVRYKRFGPVEPLSPRLSVFTAGPRMRVGPSCRLSAVLPEQELLQPAQRPA